jgi:hypothetical protein
MLCKHAGSVICSSQRVRAGEILLMHNFPLLDLEMQFRLGGHDFIYRLHAELPSDYSGRKLHAQRFGE